MADNFSFTEGSGKTGAADDIGGVLHPRVKVGWGPDGTFNDSDTASGKALPVQLRDASGTAVAPLTESDFDTKTGSLTETAPASDTASSGLNGRLQRIAQRITSLIALIPAALTGLGNFKVAVQEALPAGTNNIGDVDILSIAAGDNNIGNVDVVSSALPTGASTLAEQQSQTTHLATIAGDTTDIEAAVELIDDTVATLGTTTYTEAATKGLIVGAVRRDADTTLVDTTNEVGPLQMDANGRLKVEAFSGEVLPVSDNAGSLTVDQPTGSNLHTVVDSGTITTVSTVTSVTAIGTSVTPGTSAAHLGKAEDAAHASGDTGVMSLAVRTDTAAASSGTTGDYEALHTDSVGALWTRSTGELADDAAFTPGTSRVMPSGYTADETATDSVDEGDIGAGRMTLDRKQIITEQPHTAGGLTMSKTVSAASTNATSLKASAGKIYAIQASNVNAAARYLKLYNKATSPTVGTDTPVKTLIIPGNTAGAGTNIVFPTGIEFATGIAFALTTEATDAGTTSVAASEIVVNIDYK